MFEYLIIAYQRWKLRRIIKRQCRQAFFSHVEFSDPAIIKPTEYVSSEHTCIEFVTNYEDDSQ